jgi:hypothetical protein
MAKATENRKAATAGERENADGEEERVGAGQEEGGKAKEKRDDFCVVDSNGIHEVSLDFCTCALAEDHDIQLLRARLYPSGCCESFTCFRWRQSARRTTSTTAWRARRTTRVSSNLG